MPEENPDAQEAQPKKTVRKPRAKKEDSPKTPKTPAKKAPAKADEKKPAAKKTTTRKAPAKKKEPAKKKTDGLVVEEVSAKESEEWSPKESAKESASRAARPKRERLDIVSEDDDIPTSFKASPDDKPERPREDNESEGESHGGDDNDNRRRNSRDNRRDNNNRNRRDRNDRNGRDNRDNRRDNNRNNQNNRNNRNRDNNQNRNNSNNRNNPRQQNQKNNRQNKNRPEPQLMVLNDLPQWEILSDVQAMEAKAQEIASAGETFNLNEVLALGSADLLSRARELGVEWEGAPIRDALIKRVLEAVATSHTAIVVEGVVDVISGEAVLAFAEENYKVKAASPYLPKSLVNKYVIERGTCVKVQLYPAFEEAQSPMPMAIKVLSIMGEAPEANLAVTPFEELTPYYPTKRILLETHPDAKWDNFSMRITDLLTPIGFGQRGLIVAPPRTGKTILMQGMANAISENHPEAHLIVLLVDERPEEVTDFKRQVKGEVVSSTFDETPLSHVHAAEIVIEKARRMVERGQDVVILLDSITRLARAYNAMMPSSGKIMSGGVESNALQKPKRFFGSARNIEEGGSLTILGTALVDTGSKMDEVIFEEFKGTGNMELHLDRGLVDKRLFPAIALDKSGTRKEELLYHPDEMQKVYGLRRAMKGISPIEAMEMLLGRVKKTRTNIEFLMGLSR